MTPAPFSLLRISLLQRSDEFILDFWLKGLHFFYAREAFRSREEFARRGGKDRLRNIRDESAGRRNVQEVAMYIIDFFAEASLQFYLTIAAAIALSFFSE